MLNWFKKSAATPAASAPITPETPSFVATVYGMRSWKHGRTPQLDGGGVLGLTKNGPMGTFAMYYRDGKRVDTLESKTVIWVKMPDRIAAELLARTKGMAHPGGIQVQFFGAIIADEEKSAPQFKPYNGEVHMHKNMKMVSCKSYKIVMESEPEWVETRSFAIPDLEDWAPTTDDKYRKALSRADHFKRYFDELEKQNAANQPTTADKGAKAAELVLNEPAPADDSYEIVDLG